MPLLPIAFRASLDRIFAFDLAPHLPEGVSVSFAYITRDGEDSDMPVQLDAEIANEGAQLLLIPQDNPVLPFATTEDPNARVATLWLQPMGGGEPFEIAILAPFDPMLEPAGLRGTAGADTLVFDRALAPAAGLVIDTSGGSDLATVLGGPAIMLGRAGNDTLMGAEAEDALYGGGGNDRLIGQGGMDRLVGMNGNDRLFGGGERDILFGGNGNDILEGGDGDDTLVAGSGLDTLRGGVGDDTLVKAGTGKMSPFATDRAPSFAYGGEGNDSLFGFIGASEIHGGNGQDRLSIDQAYGGALYGGADNDTLDAYASGTDPFSETPITGILATSLFGGAGDDVLSLGGRGALQGGTGNDDLSGWGTLWGGDGDDTIDAQRPSSVGDIDWGTALVYGGAGNDTIAAFGGSAEMHGGDGFDQIYGGDGDDTIHGGSMNDFLRGGAGSDLLYGGDADDQMAATDRTDGGNLVTLGMHDTLYGGAGSDFMRGERAGHTYYGGADGDAIVVSDTPGNILVSTVYGDAGNDSLQLQGNASAYGGTGQDVFMVDKNNSSVYSALVAEDFTRGEDRLQIVFGDNSNYIGNLILITDGNGAAGLRGDGLVSLSWQHEADNGGVRVFFDTNGDAQADAEAFLVGLTDLQAGDLGWQDF